MQPTIIAFLSHLKAERNASPHTLRSYEDDLEQFCQFLAESYAVEPDQVDPLGVDAKRLRRYSAWLTGRSYAATTVARRLASLRSFYRFQRRQGVMTDDPTGGLRNPKQPQRLPRLLRVDEVIGLLDSLPVDSDFGIRDRAMFETLYGGDCASVNWSVSTEMISIRNKDFCEFEGRDVANGSVRWGRWRSCGFSAGPRFGAPSELTSPPCFSIALAPGSPQGASGDCSMNT